MRGVKWGGVLSETCCIWLHLVALRRGFPDVAWVRFAVFVLGMVLRAAGRLARGKTPHPRPLPAALKRARAGASSARPGEGGWVSCASWASVGRGVLRAGD